MTPARRYHGQYTRVMIRKWRKCRKCARQFKAGMWLKYRRILWILKLTDHYLCTNCLRSEAQAKNRV